MAILDEIEARGLLQDVSDREELGKLLAHPPVTFYCGYDPTAVSLHAGNLVPLSLMRHLAAAGHKMIALVGGATGMVGDPSGRTSERKLLDEETLALNQRALEAQIQRLISADAQVVNNAEWLGPIGFLQFLRDVGKHMTVNYMLGKESVRARLEDRDHGISYTEFSYMLLQAKDFVHLAETRRCRLQVGGSDQWGNITCGIELHRKMSGGTAPPIFGMTAPLLLDASGKKFGKSEKGQNVWLDRAMTSPYQFYQFWVNADDRDVGRYLSMFTMIPLPEVAEIAAAHAAAPERREGQKILAREVTTWVHGAEDAARARKASELMFGQEIDGLTDADLEALVGEVPLIVVPLRELDGGLLLVDLLARTSLATSKGEARRLIAQGGAYVNNRRVEDIQVSLTPATLEGRTTLFLRAGKRKMHLVRFQ
ncbi:MAG TPA: tyrosine--tRNA ligase [Haliangiales bacterium]|nr:tyrosine--tRNA ligase [Haliangiales bacterium]